MRLTPSELHHLEHPIVCYYFDRAIWLFGSSVEADLNAVDSKTTNPKSAAARRQMMLNRWIPAKGGNTRGRFRDPAVGLRAKKG